MSVKGISASTIDFQKMTENLRRASESLNGNKTSGEDSEKLDFFGMLEKGIKEVNTSSKVAEKASMDLATGKSSNIHETMLAVTKAELGFNMMVQLRNKVIESYQEVERMQI